MGLGWIKKGEFLTWGELEETEKKGTSSAAHNLPHPHLHRLSIFEIAECMFSPKVTTCGPQIATRYNSIMYL